MAKIVEYTASVSLKHLSVRVETRISEFGNLLGEQFNTVRRIAEDNGLVNLKLREKSVEAVDLLLLFNKCVVLCDTSQREFIHKIYLIGIIHVFILSVLAIRRECSSGRGVP